MTGQPEFPTDAQIQAVTDYLRSAGHPDPGDRVHIDTDTGYISGSLRQAIEAILDATRAVGAHWGTDQ